MRRRSVAWLVRLLALLAAVAVIVPAVRTLRAAREPMPLPDRTWNLPAARVTPRPVSAPQLPPNTVAIPELDVRLGFHDAGTTGGWLDLDDSITTGVHLADGSSLTRGSFLVAAHVNSRDLSLSPFAKLWQVQPGTVVYASDAAGRVHGFKTVALAHYGKDDLPDDLWQAEGPSRLVLVTCGGKLSVRSDGRRSYAENVVVRAVPLASSGQ